MKKSWICTLVFVMLCLASVGLAEIAVDETHFPDEKFRSIISLFDTDENGALSSAEIAQIREIDCSNIPLTSLKGVELLSSLEYLDCTQTGLDSLDVSRNKKLKTLWCSINNLTSLDVRSNRELVQLGCASNQLKKLDVSRNTKLSELYCDLNEIGKLDVTACTKLSELVKKGTRINMGEGIDYWANSSSWLYVDSSMVVKAGNVLSRPINAATAVTENGGIYLIQDGEAALIGPSSATLKKLIMPDAIQVSGRSCKVTSVVPDACENMTELVSVKIGRHVKILGNKAFQGCPKLKTVSGGEGVTTIGERTFAGDLALTRFTFFRKVNKIGKNAFLNCGKLKTLVFKTTGLTAGSIGANAFKGIHANARVTCPAGKAKLYQRIFLKKGMGKQVVVK